MNSGKAHREEDEEEEEEFGEKKDEIKGTTIRSHLKKNFMISAYADGKRNDKSNATTRSKHSVTEQRRRSKINERFQILRKLIPNSDQKRDTASFLFEVIQYVQFLQENVTKYEGSYQPWSSEPAKLTPWRNNHWRNLSGQPQTPKNSPGTAFPIRFDESSAVVSATIQPSPHSSIEPGHARDASCRPIDLQTELPNKTMSIQDGSFSHLLRGPPSLDAQSTECPNSLNLQDELPIEGGMISVSNIYSQGNQNQIYI